VRECQELTSAPPPRHRNSVVKTMALVPEPSSTARPMPAPQLVIPFTVVLTYAGFADFGVAERSGRLPGDVPNVTAANPPLRDSRSDLRAQLDLALEAAGSIDEDEGTPPSKAAFRDAAAFIELLPASTPLPSVYASGDAEVGFTWSGPGRFLEVAFRGDGYLRWAAAFGEHRPGGAIAIDLQSATRLPKALADLIDQL